MFEEDGHTQRPTQRAWLSHYACAQPYRQAEVATDSCFDLVRSHQSGAAFELEKGCLWLTPCKLDGCAREMAISRGSVPPSCFGQFQLLENTKQQHTSSGDAMIRTVMNAISANFSNCVDKPEKIRTITGFETVFSWCRCDALTSWAKKPQMVGAANLWIQIINIGFILYIISFNESFLTGTFKPTNDQLASCRLHSSVGWSVASALRGYEFKPRWSPKLSKFLYSTSELSKLLISIANIAFITVSS